MLRPPENSNNAASTHPKDSSLLQYFCSKEQLIKLSSEELVKLIITLNQENISQASQIVELEKENAVLQSQLSEKAVQIDDLKATKALLSRLVDRGEQPQPQQKAEPDAQHADYCSYIIPNNIKSKDEIENELAQAAKGKARTLAEYLKKAVALGYIDLRGDDEKTIFEELKNRYAITYSYSNWMAYR